MNGGLQIFSNDEFELRINPDGDSFKVEAPGLARALGMRDAHRLVESIPEEEKVKAYTTACTPAEQEIWHVKEPGFYRAIGQRQAARVKNLAIRDQVERFQNWVYREVLPAIRKTGSYSLTPQPAVPSYPEALELAAAKIREVEAQGVVIAAQAMELDVTRPKAHAWDVLATADGDLSVAEAAKLLSRDPAIEVGQNRLFDVMEALGWVFRNRAGDWAPKQDQVDNHRLTTLPQFHWNKKTGKRVMDSPQVRVMVKGLQYLHRHLGGTGRLQVQGQQLELLHVVAEQPALFAGASS